MQTHYEAIYVIEDAAQGHKIIDWFMLRRNAVIVAKSLNTRHASMECKAHKMLVEVSGVAYMIPTYYSNGRSN